MDPVEPPFVGRADELARVLSCASHPGGGTLLVIGPVGMGRTRLARQGLGSLATAGWRTEWVTGSRSAASIPFGALAHLLPPGWCAENGAVSAVLAIDERLREPGRRLALAVDDAHLLDPASATVVGHLATRAAAFVVVTTPVGTHLPDAIVPTWSLELPRLSTEEVERLITGILGPDVDGVSRRRLRRAVDGNPLALRELVRAAVAGQVLRQRCGVWTWDPWTAWGCRDAVGSTAIERVRSLAPAVRLVVELVALGGPLSLPMLERLAGAAAIEEAEDDRLIVVERSGSRALVRLAHPLLGIAVRTEPPAFRARQRYRQLAAAALATPLRRTDDTLRAAVWQVAGECVSDAEVVLAGARQALRRGENALAERLAQAAHDAAPGPLADRVLAQVLCARGRGAGRSRTTLFDGDCATALACAQSVLRRRDADEGAVVWAAASATAAAGFLGRTDEAMRTYERGLASAGKRGSVADWATIQLGYGGCVAQLASGDLVAAAELALAGYREAVDTDAAVPAGGWAALRGLAAAGQGRSAEAATALREAVALLEHDDPIGIVRLCLVCLGAVTALAGDPAAGRTWLELADRRPGRSARLLLPWTEQWRAWAIAASESAGAAIPVAQHAARLASTVGLPTVEAAALYDVVRLGGGEQPRLSTVADRLGTPFAAATALAASGLARADGADLARVTDVFVGLGHHLLAAECSAAAGQAYRRQGHRGPARVHAEQAAVLRSRCPDVRTPLLEVDGVTGLLTLREREVVILATSHTSPQIAERLGLSARTVSNNLSRAYAKLGVSGRDELRTLLGVRPGPRGPTARAGTEPTGLNGSGWSPQAGRPEA